MDVEIVVNNRKIAKTLARLFDIEVIYHHIMSKKILQDISVNKDDMVIFISPETEDNIMHAIMFRNAGYTRGIVILDRIPYLDLSTLIAGFSVININQVVVDSMAKKLQVFDISPCFQEVYHINNLSIFLIKCLNEQTVQVITDNIDKITLLFVQRDMSLCISSDYQVGDYLLCYSNQNFFTELNSYIVLKS